MPSVATGPAPVPAPLVSQRIAKLQPDGSAIKCLFSDVASLTISRFLAGFIHLSDEIEFDPTAVDPAVSFLAELAGQGDALELAS